MADNAQKSPAEVIAELTDGSGQLAPDAEGKGATEETREPREWGFDVEIINRDHALVLMGAKAVVFKSQQTGPIQDRVRILSLDALYAWYANKFTEIKGHDGKIKVVTWGRRWVQHRSRRQFSGIEFFPNPDGTESTPDYLNLWRGFGVAPAANGSYNIFRDHLLNNVCAGNDELFRWLFAWFAHLMQQPRERIGTALVLRGRMGTGKTKVGEVFGSLIPAHYFPVDDPRYITGQFNAHMASCLLLQAEEAVWAGDKAAEGRLKGLVTSDYNMIESKGIDPIKIRNYVRLLMTSNEDWVVPAGKDERRFCVLDVDPRCAQNHDYFREMDDELESGGRARLLFDLLHFDLNAVNLRQVPQTRALFEQKLQTFDSVESWWFSRLVEAAPTRGMDSWPPQIAVAAAYADYVHATEQIGARRKRDPATFGLKLAKLAPGIERSRPRLETEPGTVRRVYSYVLPSLDECRASFEAMVGQPIDWPGLSGSEGEPPAIEAADEIVPA